MKLDKKIKSIVITYEDEECVRAAGKQAEAFQKCVRAYFDSYQYFLQSEKYSYTEDLDITRSIDYEIIRNGLR